MSGSDERAPCPCGTGRAYETCCGRYHRCGEPEDAETLMRSRYAAFVKRDVAYLYRTLHPDHDDRATPFERFAAGMRTHFASGVAYQRLDVLDATPADRDGIAKVLFRATLRQRGKDRSFTELSSFAHDGTGWRYLVGTILGPADARETSIAALEKRGIR